MNFRILNGEILSRENLDLTFSDKQRSFHAIHKERQLLIKGHSWLNQWYFSGIVSAKYSSWKEILKSASVNGEMTISTFWLFQHKFDNIYNERNFFNVLHGCEFQDHRRF